VRAEGVAVVEAWEVKAKAVEEVETEMESKVGVVTGDVKEEEEETVAAAMGLVGMVAPRDCLEEEALTVC
jgi:hypothetical protein